MRKLPLNRDFYCHCEERWAKSFGTLKKAFSQRDAAIPPVCVPKLLRAIAKSLTFAAGVSILALLAGCAPSLHDTVARKDAETARAMIQADPGLVRARNGLGKTPLHYAVTYGADAMVGLLVDHGADVNAPDNTGLTPLHVAAMLNRRDEAKALLEQGADINARDEFGDTPLHTAALFGRPQMARLLAQNGADLNALNNKQLTPLQCARQQRKPEVVELLQELH